MMRDAKVLVAGGSGLVGTNLTRRLMADGVDVLSSYHSRPPAESAEVYRRFDFTRFEDCLQATGGRDVVFLCASQISGARLMRERPTEFILPNLQINAGLLEACSRNKVRKVVLISSSTVYQPASFPIAEEQLDLNQQPYELYFGIGWLNRYLEQLAAFHRKAHGIAVEIVRATNIYGPHDHFDDEKSHVIPALIKRAVAGEDPFVVWGDGTAVRNFHFVDDFVEDLMIVAENDLQGLPLNAGSAENLTIRDAVEIILSIAGHAVEPVYDPSKPTAIPYRALNTARLESIKQRKRPTSFREGIKRTIDWYRNTLC